jgi:hypothetical protein
MGRFLCGDAPTVTPARAGVYRADGVGASAPGRVVAAVLLAAAGGLRVQAAVG